MAAVVDTHAVASGFDAGEAARRRNNVAGAPQPAVVKPVEAEDKTKAKKVRSPQSPLSWP
jgi:hypothetical protein